MTPTTPLVAPAPVSATTRRPSGGRRAAVVAAAVPAALLPTVWGVGAAVQLATGVEPDHRFHQLTGQGILLAVLWLSGVVPLVAAGVRGRRPSTTGGLRHLAFVAAAVATAALAPGNGGAAVAAVVVVTGALLWAVLPLRPALRGAFSGGLDLLLAPVALLTAALAVPYALAQAALQRTSRDEHAQMTHYFDMTWVCLVVVAFAVVAAVSAPARAVGTWAGAALVVIGAARLAVTGESGWSVPALALGAAGLAAAAWRSRSAGTTA